MSETKICKRGRSARMLIGLLRWTILAALSSSLVLQLAAQDNSKDKDGGVHFLYRVGVGLNLQTRACHVSGVPASIRAVPAHPDDGGGALPPIKDTELGCPYAHFNPIAEFGIKKQGLRREYSVALSVSYNLWSEANTGETERMNYTNAPGTSQRGQGAALTFYGPIDRHDGLNDLVLGGFFQVSFYRKSESRWFIKAGSDFPQSKIVTGWDRFDSLQNFQSFNLGRIVQPYGSFGLEFKSSLTTTRFYSRAAFPFLFKSTLGEQVGDLHFLPSINGGFDFLFGK